MRRAASLIGAAVGVALILSACTPTDEPAPVPTSTRTATPTEPTPEPTPSGPVLVADGTAVDNLPIFEVTVQAVAGSDARMAAGAYTAALVAAGFGAETVQATADRTSVGDPVDSLQIAVGWAGECLLAHIPAGDAGAVVTIVPALASGGCLVGDVAGAGG
ncbi:hypothetical protein AOA12_10235 [Microbacterium sp. No. 7]|nr:hypothetical protein AOA12_10235 [Microbacterium sp. No. 7]